MEQSKTCSCCEVEKELSSYPKGHGRICQDCKNSKQRQRRADTNDSCTKRYEKTIKGYLMRTYRNMLSRVTGVQTKKAHLYEGLDILSKEEFYSWAISNEEFNILFENYKNSNYEMRLAPSIDRRDSSLGYCLENMRWLPHWENSQLGVISRYSK